LKTEGLAINFMRL